MLKKNAERWKGRGRHDNKQQIPYEEKKKTHTETSKVEKTSYIRHPTDHTVQEVRVWKEMQHSITKLCSGKLKLQWMNTSHLPKQKSTLYPNAMPHQALVAKISNLH